VVFHAGYVINFANISREEILRASEDSFLCDYRRMEQLFARCARKRNWKGICLISHVEVSVCIYGTLRNLLFALWD
jgi:endonuclease IV